ncbi:MAG: ubiquinone/menaquinone biosynthesis methyltransferase [Gemmatimonadota bacterium]|jgi:demethylmenaquinone methyltransferase/2-methoxy-6-polyprenyl-1,4-benzoquinol methylase|nr:ubiquinone/menaquinone biosynthesis methyltransferase [Gemmatimonadota bacterium]
MSAAVTDERQVAAAAAQGRSAAGKRAYVRRMFSDIAPRYDLLNHVLSLNIDKGWRTRAIAALGLGRVPQGRVLDLCAGTLDVGAAITRTPGFGGTVIGADFAVPMLQGGRGKAPAGRLQPVAADALELPLADACMDGAIVAFGIRNLADLDAGLREVRRVCRPGARFVILEFSTPSNPLVRAGYHAYFHHVLPAVGRLVSGHATAYAYLPASVVHFPTGDALAARMTAAGWADVRWTPVTFGVAAIHVGTVPAA